MISPMHVVMEEVVIERGIQILSQDAPKTHLRSVLQVPEPGLRRPWSLHGCGSSHTTWPKEQQRIDGFNLHLEARGSSRESHTS